MQSLFIKHFFFFKSFKYFIIQISILLESSDSFPESHLDYQLLQLFVWGFIS